MSFSDNFSRARQHLEYCNCSFYSRATTFFLSQEKYTDSLTAAVDIGAQGLHCVGAELLNVRHIYDAQKYYADLNREARREFCSTAFVGGALTIGFPSNHILCQTCFCKYHGIALATFTMPIIIP